MVTALYCLFISQSELITRVIFISVHWNVQCTVQTAKRTTMNWSPQDHTDKTWATYTHIKWITISNIWLCVLYCKIVFMNLALDDIYGIVNNYNLIQNAKCILHKFAKSFMHFSNQSTWFLIYEFDEIVFLWGVDFFVNSVSYCTYYIGLQKIEYSTIQYNIENMKLRQSVPKYLI